MDVKLHEYLETLAKSRANYVMYKVSRHHNYSDKSNKELAQLFMDYENATYMKSAEYYDVRNIMEQFEDFEQFPIYLQYAHTVKNILQGTFSHPKLVLLRYEYSTTFDTLAKTLYTTYKMFDGRAGVAEKIRGYVESPENLSYLLYSPGSLKLTDDEVRKVKIFDYDGKLWDNHLRNICVIAPFSVFSKAAKAR